MDDTHESEKKTADLFAENTQPSELIESPNSNALTMPERPQSIKRRHSLAIPGLNKMMQTSISARRKNFGLITLLNLDSYLRADGEIKWWQTCNTYRANR